MILITKARLRGHLWEHCDLTQSHLYICNIKTKYTYTICVFALPLYVYAFNMARYKHTFLTITVALQNESTMCFFFWVCKLAKTYIIISKAFCQISSSTFFLKQLDLSNIKNVGQILQFEVI